MKIYVDVHSRKTYPADSLSNFAAHAFTLDGVSISCMEGLLQSLKVSPELQADTCMMDARTAKRVGSEIRWQDNGGMFHWQGQYFSRFSPEYRAFLERAYDALTDQNPEYAKALLDSGHSILWHSIGKLRKRDTCLTTWEFVHLLYRERRRARQQGKGHRAPM